MITKREGWENSGRKERQYKNVFFSQSLLEASGAQLQLLYEVHLIAVCLQNKGRLSTDFWPHRTRGSCRFWCPRILGLHMCKCQAGSCRHPMLQSQRISRVEMRGDPYCSPRGGHLVAFVWNWLKTSWNCACNSSLSQMDLWEFEVVHERCPIQSTPCTMLRSLKSKQSLPRGILTVKISDGNINESQFDEFWGFSLICCGISFLGLL